MKRQTLKSQILRKFKILYREKGNPFVNGGAIERFAMEIGFKGSTASRELRLMAENGILERQEFKNPNTNISSVSYKYIPTRNEILSANFKRMNETTNTTM